jgi:hypothetical protein
MGVDASSQRLGDAQSPTDAATVINEAAESANALIGSVTLGAVHFQLPSLAAAFTQDAHKGRWVMDFAESAIATHLTVNKLFGFRTDATGTVRANIKTVLPWFPVLAGIVASGALLDEKEDADLKRTFSLHAVASSPPTTASPTSIDGLYALEELLSPYSTASFVTVHNSLRTTVDAVTANKSGSATLRQLFAHVDYLRPTSASSRSCTKTSGSSRTRRRAPCRAPSSGIEPIFNAKNLVRVVTANALNGCDAT